MLGKVVQGRYLLFFSLHSLGVFLHEEIYTINLCIKKYQSEPHKDGNGLPQGEEPCDVTTVQMFRQDARRGEAPFELWK